MSSFIDLAFSLPTAVFTVLLAVMMSYWIFVILGFLDIDLFDFDVDIDLDGAVDAGIDGAAEGAAEGAMEGALEGSADAGASLFGQILSLLSVGTVPVTILATFLAFFGFIFSFLGAHFLSNILGMTLGALAILGILAGSFLLATTLTGFAARPFRGLFETVTSQGGAALVGQVCVITTGKVTTSFGQATLDDGAGGLNLSVRLDDDAPLSRGEQALIIGYDQASNTFLVEPFETVLGLDTPLGATPSASLAQKTETRSSGESS